jgi:hypothetical protein
MQPKVWRRISTGCQWSVQALHLDAVDQNAMTQELVEGSPVTRAAKGASVHR